MPHDPRPTPALLAPLAAIRRDFAALLHNRSAFAGGLLGSALTCALAAGLVLLSAGPSHGRPPAESDDLDMQFLPGELVRRGERPDPQDMPVKTVVRETQAAELPVSPTVTLDDHAAPAPDPAPADPTPKITPHERPDPQRKGAPKSDHNQASNTPYDDLPTVERPPGDPFASPDGWSDLAKDGDPWATAVLAALNGMTVGSYAGLGQEASFKFQLIVCADGSIAEVRTRLSTGRPDFDGQIRNALTALKLPKAPPAIAAQLGSKCKKIPYEFTWRGASQRGSVH